MSFTQPTLLAVNSQGENAVSLTDSEPNSHFAVNLTNMNFGRNTSVALRSISLNVAPVNPSSDPVINSQDKLQLFVLCNIVRADTKVGTQKTDVLRELVVSQSNERQVFDFDTPIYVPCVDSNLSRIEFKLVTNSFQKTVGAVDQLHSVHTPHTSNGTQLILAFLPQAPSTKL